MTRPSDDDVTLASALVTEAGRLAARMRADGVRADQKSSASDLVTEADRAAEELILTRLRAARPDDSVLGEEGTRVEGRNGRRWVIDPVDGTFNFVQGLSWWCSAIALTDAGQGVLGAVHHPHDDVVWCGGPEVPTRRAGRPVTPIMDRPLADCALTTYLHPVYFDRPDVAGPFTAMAAAAKVLRMGGSGSMDLAAVADGRLDLWCQHTVPSWDWLPGQALVAGAGGTTRQVEVAGIVWSIAGPATAVAEAAARLRAGAPA